jgi:hypothetical protein
MAVKSEKTQKVYSALLSLRGDPTQQVRGEWTGAELAIFNWTHGRGGTAVCLADVNEIGEKPFRGNAAEYDDLARRYGKDVLPSVFGLRANAIIPTAYQPQPDAEAAETAEA